MSINTRCIYINSTFIATSLILLLILFIRVTRCLDLTDEMFYYGVIEGLIETGRLFSNDLFIQQIVYILFYPVFYLYHFIFGFEGLVFFGRLLMALLSIVVFLYAYRKLLEFKLSTVVASLTALSLTFAIPYHGIFAPSYNTISQILWIVFTLRFFEWRESSAVSWGILPIIMVFAHPTSAVMMSLLILARLLVEREFRQVARLLLVFLGGALIVTPVIFHFAALEEYLASLTFSSGYGVGTAFFSSKSQPIRLLVIYAMFGGCLLFWRRFHGLGFPLLASFFIAVAIVLFSAGLTGGAYTPRIVYVLSSLSALAYGWSLSNVPEGDIKFRERMNWLVMGLLAYATTLIVTSSNGMGQATGAFMVGLPLLLGIAVSSRANKEGSDSFSYAKTACVILVFTLFVVHWSRYPYREDSLWRTNTPIGSVSEFRFINTSSERAHFIFGMQQALGKTTEGKRTLIISEYPALYFALDTIPETCMLYMFSVNTDKSEKALLECFEKKSPQVIVDIVSDKDMSSEGSRIKKIMSNYFANKGYVCDVGPMRFHSNSNYNPSQLKVSVCKHAV